MRELAPKMSAFPGGHNNKALWGKVEALWQGREGLGLTGEQARVLELSADVRAFRRGVEGRRRSG